MSDHNRIGSNGGQQQQVQIPAANIMMTGLKAEFHAKHHQMKQNNPKYRFDCGFDLFPTVGPYKIENHRHLDIIMVGTCFHMMIPPGAFGWITDRSSTTKLLEGGWILDGKIDATYTGELIVRVACSAEDTSHVQDTLNKLAVTQKAIAQIVVNGCVMVVPNLVDKLPNHIGRGTAGFGSTNS